MNLGPYTIQEAFRSVEYYKNTDELGDIIDAISKYSSRKIMWRGFNIKNRSIFSFVSGQGVKHRNKNLGAETIFKKLKVKNPAFAAWGQSKARFFGTPHIIVPVGNHTIWQSDKVDDVSTFAQEAVYTQIDKTMRKQTGTRTEKEQKEMAELGAKTYKKTDKHNHGHEIIVDAAEYYLVNPLYLVEQGNKDMRTIISKEKLSTKKLDKLEKHFKTYNDLGKAIEKYKGFQQWKIDKGYVR